MKKRILALLLTFVMLVGMMPVNAFATETEQTNVEPCTVTEGCTFAAGHEGNCSNYVAPTEACETEGCTYGAGHEGNCSNYVAPTEACETESCTYGAGHEGNCSNFVACDTEGCEYAFGHEGSHSNYVAPTEACPTEGCTYGAGHEGNCSNFVACETEGCTFAAGHEGNCSNAAALIDDVEPAADAVVYVTIGNAGTLALANASVTVTDINADGVLTYEEALIAAHKAYCPSGESGYYAQQSTYGSFVTTLWGVETGGSCYFFKNNVALDRGVSDTESSTVATGDSIYATILSDSTTWSDWYTYFDKTSLTVEAGEEFTLTLNGFAAMSDGTVAASAISGVSVGTWSNGTFTALSGKTTDANGQVTLSFDTAGTYYISASGNESGGSPIMAPVCVVTVKEAEKPAAGLAALKFTNGSKDTSLEYALSPAFSSAVTEYTLTIPDSTASIYAWATLADGVSDTISVAYTNTSGTANTVTLTSGKTTGTSLSSAVKSGTFDGNTLTVTVGDVVYTVKIQRLATLSKLVVAFADTSAVTFTPTFSATTTAYMAKVPHDAVLTVTPTVKTTGAVAAVSGVAEDGTVTPAWNDLSAEITITVSGENAVTNTYTITLQQLAKSIEIQKAPTKATYEVGEIFDPTGMELKASYEGGSTATILPESFTYSPTEKLSQSMSEITVIYDGLSVQQAITVKAAFEGAGTAETPYLIKTADDLVLLSQLVADGLSFSGEYFRMTADITLPSDWTPLGVSASAPFSGNFDGDNHLLTVPEGGLPLIGTPKGASLSKLNIYGSKIAGYGVVNNYCEIGKAHAITIENVTLKSGTQTLKAGFIGGYASGSDTVTIRNCTVQENVVIGYDRSQKWIGSFGGEFNGTIENCVSYATVYGTDFVGGIVSNKGQSMGTFTVSNCQFYGNVVASGNYVGGIVGHGYGGTGWGFSSNAGIPTITNCTATGSVSGGNYVGGIYGGDAGVVQVWDNAAGSITGNSFTGTVSATGEYKGAIIGYLKSLNKNNVIQNNTYSASCGANKGIGYVQYVDTSCETHETSSGATYVNTANGKPGITGMTKTNLNRTDDPLGADAANLCYTDTADLLTSKSVSVSTIHEDASAGNAVTLSFDEQTNTFSGKLSNYTELDAYNDGDISVVIANIPEGATAVLNNEAGEKVADFVKGVAVTTGSTVAASGKYIFKIVLTNGAKTESCDLVLEKTTTMKWKGLVFEGIPAFSENVIYHGHPEGTLFQLDADGNRTGATGLSDDCLHYEVYVNPLTTSVKPEGTKAMDYFKTSFVPNPANKKTSIYVDDELVIENAPTTMALALKIAQLENGFELSITKERTVLRVEFKISDTEVVYSTITFVRDVNVNVDTFVTMIEELDLKSMVYPDDVTSIDVVKEYYEALSDTQKTQIPAEIQSKLTAALEWASPDRVPEKLEIVTAPAQVSYAAGDAFNPAGVELLATYSDGTTRTITPESEGFTVEPSGALTNETEVTFTYNTVKVSQPITVLTINWSGEGTEAVPYELYNAEDLQALYTYVASGKITKGLHFKVMADITLPADWKPIGALIDPSVGNINSGKNVRPFSGTLDGNGKTITVPEGGLPLLGHVNGATVKNLNIYGKQIAGYGLVNNLEGVGLSGEAICIDNVTLKSGSSTLKSGLIGTYITNNGFAGCSAAFYVTIKNCTIEKDVVVGYNKDQSMIGSIAGRIHGTIDNCVSYATVYGTSYVGGILGTRDNALGGCVVTNSQFHGTVAATGSNVGGIVGGGYPGSSAPNGYKININDCSASGSVTGADKVGGIVGADTGVVQLWGTHTLKNNSFTGTVKATDGTYVGGIIGYYASLNKYDDISGNYYKSGCGADRGIGFVQYVDTSCQTHEMAVGATYINTAEGKPDISGITKTDLNRTDDPLGADAAKLCYTDSTPVTAIELKISGTYKTTYTTGEKLDLTGIVLTVVYTDKSEETINLSDATVTGYDANKVGEQELTISYNGLTASITVTVKNPVGTIKVTVSVYGDSAHGDNGSVHTLSSGGLTAWVSGKTYEVDSNATVWDVLQQAFKDNGITYSASANNSQGTIYISSLTRGGVTLSEFTNGSNSGWMYTLNGSHPLLGVAQQYLKDGDRILFHYTDDYNKEQGSEGYGDKDEKAADAVEKRIDAIGTVTLDKADEIEAARKAYDNLTYAQKQLVDNFAKLTAAEAKYDELKAADDEKKASAVEDLIDDIMKGSTTFEDDVEAARKAFNNLTADQKKLVGNYYKLAAFLKELADEDDKEAAEAVEKLIEDLGEITLDSEDGIKAAREAYDKLTDEQKALVENLDVLEAAEERLAELKALADVADIYKTTGDYLAGLGTPVPGSVGGEWMVIGLARSDREIKDGDAYYEAVIQYVQENIDESERLHRAKSTENARLILALTAIGKDVTDVGGHNLLTGLNSMEFIQKQGINGPIWALLAFDSGNYPVPVGDVSREALIQVLLDAQLADGGWALTGTVSDPDITGMALQALAPYYKANAEVKAAVDEALVTLSEMQAADGSFGSIDGTSSESIAQVIVALSALGIDADTDTRFIKNGVSALDALCAFYVSGGGFKHIPAGKLDGMATEQGYYALAAYFRMLNDETALYNMTDVIDKGGDVEAEPDETMPAVTEPAPTDESKGGFPWWIIIVILVAGVAVALVLNRKKIFANVR